MASSDEKIMKNVIKKVPGIVSPLGSFEHEKIELSNLKEKSEKELVELLERQEKLLSNKNLLKILPDKGKKILNRKNEIKEALEKKKEINQASEAFEKLLISNAKPEITNIEELEWKYGSNSFTKSKTTSDQNRINNIEDDPTDPIAILATSCLPPKKEANTNSQRKENYGQKLSEKIDSLSKSKENFKPYKSLHSQVPPPDISLNLVHSPNNLKKCELKSLVPDITESKKQTLDISLQESLKLMHEQTKKLKEIQLLQAGQHLKNITVNTTSENFVLPHNITEYRDRDENSEIDSEDEVIDEDALDQGTLITFSGYD